MPAGTTLMPCEFVDFRTGVKIPFFWVVSAHWVNGSRRFETTCVPVTQGDIPEENRPPHNVTNSENYMTTQIVTTGT
jgi:hypothetical protein